MNTPAEIIDGECEKLLARMDADHPGAGVGISLALFSPTTPDGSGCYQYGMSGPGSPITASTIYGIGSVTKVFTATLAASLVVHGTVDDLSAPVGPYLTNAACSPGTVSGPYWSRASFFELATQTSGMPDEANGPFAWQLFTAQPPSCQQLDWWNANQAIFASDEGFWVYSSAGFVTLGFAVAAAAKLGYPTLLTSEITGVLGMGQSFLANDVPTGGQLAQGYEGRAKPVTITEAADMKSTAQDMLTWLGAVSQSMELAAGGSPCTPLQQAMADTTRVWIDAPVAPPPPGTTTGFSMGLGWQIPTIDSAGLGNYQILAKNGAASGCSCWAGLTRFDPRVPPVGVVLLTNQRGVRPDGCARAILTQIVDLAAG